MSLTSPNDYGSPYVDASCGRADPMKRCVADTRACCYLVMVSVQGFNLKSGVFLGFVVYRKNRLASYGVIAPCE